MVNKRLHFGVILSTVEQPIQYLIWQSIEQYARNNDIHLTAYFGSYQTMYHGAFQEAGDEPSLHYDTCFELIKNSDLDGLMVFSGFIVQNIGLKKFEKYIAGVPKHIPIVSISYLMPEISSVLIGNTSGMYDAVDHLIKVHNKKKIAFIKGPDKHMEAEERFDGYKNALADNGITLDLNYVFPGNFSKSAGHDAVVEMYDVRNLSVEAIAACDDETAIGAMNELKARNIAIPNDIAVVGFDDDRIAELYIPPLSTVRQDFYKLGTASMEVMHKMAKKEPVDNVTYVDSEFITRRSCGCGNRVLLNQDFKYATGLIEAESLTSFVMLNIAPAIKDEKAKEQVFSWVTDLIRVVEETPFYEDDFLDLLNEKLDQDNAYAKDYNLWKEMLTILKLGVIRYCNNEYAKQIMNTLVTALIFVQEARFRNIQSDMLSENDLRIQVRGLSGTIISSLDTEILAKTLRQVYSELSINMVFIGLYKNPIRSNDPDAAREISTAIGYDKDIELSIKQSENSPVSVNNYYAIKGLDFEARQRVLFFMPLFFNEEEMGILQLSYNSRIPIDIYETLRISISTAIKGSKLVMTHRLLSLTDELTRIYNRRGFFQFAESRLKYMARERGVTPVVIYMDMDGLKYINDTFGHFEGDVAIKAFSKILQKCFRRGDIIGRMGGDEFAVMSTIKTGSSYLIAEERVRKEIDNYNSKKLHPYEIKASFGCVILKSLTIECLEEAMDDADKLLYDEKQMKRNTKV